MYKDIISDNNSMADGRATMKKKFCTLLKLKLVLIQTILLAINILMVTPRATTKKKTGLVTGQISEEQFILLTSVTGEIE